MITFNNPIYEFCLYVGFAGMLLKDLNISMSTGFHIYSYEGGKGKTLACKVAATVMGNVDYIVHQWNQTTNNLDLICAKSNNGLLVLDEIKQLKKSCALSDIIMKLGNNKGAGRMAQDTQSSREHFSWLMYYLSTGNNLTEQIIFEREGNNLLGAEETRLYNMQMIKAQEFHGLNDHREFTKHLYTNIDKHCGIAGYEFLTQYLNSNYDDNKRYLLGIFEDMQNKIQNLIHTNKKELNNCDVHDRIISAFSVVATAGEMAKHLKILPDEFNPLESVWYVLFEYLKNRGGNIDQRTYLTKLYQYVVTERNTYFKHDNSNFEPKYNYGCISKVNGKDYAEIITTNFANIYGFSNYKDTAVIRDFLINCGVMVGNVAYQKNGGKRYIKIDIEVLENLVT